MEIKSKIMNVKELKELIKDLPDDLEVYTTVDYKDLYVRPIANGINIYESNIVDCNVDGWREVDKEELDELKEDGVDFGFKNILLIG